MYHFNRALALSQATALVLQADMGGGIDMADLHQVGITSTVLLLYMPFPLPHPRKVGIAHAPC